MAKTYTLPTLKTPSGDVVVKFISSWESGSATQSNSYILDMSPLNLEIEIEGGALANDTIDLEVYDKDLLFTNTFITPLQSDNTYTLYCEIYLSSVRLFKGFIDKETISIKHLYSQTNGSDSLANVVSFSVLWNISLLKYKPMYSLVDAIISHHSTDLLNYTGTSYLISIDKLFNRLLSLIPNISYSGSISTDIKLAGSDSLNPAQYNFINIGAKTINSEDLGEGYLLFSSGHTPPFKENCVGCFKIGVDVNSFSTDEKTEVDVPLSSFYNKNDCYSILIELLKGFNLILRVDYSDINYDAVLSVGKRIYGNLITPTNLIESNKEFHSSVTRDEYEVSMVGSDVVENYKRSDISQSKLAIDVPCGVMSEIPFPNIHIAPADNEAEYNTNMNNQLNVLKNSLIIKSQYNEYGVSSSVYYMYARYLHKNIQYFQNGAIQDSEDPTWYVNGGLSITYGSGGHTGTSGVSGFISTPTLNVSTTYTDKNLRGIIEPLNEDCLIFFFYQTSTATSTGFTCYAEILDGDLNRIEIINPQDNVDGLRVQESNTIKSFFYDSKTTSSWSVGSFYFRQNIEPKSISHFKLHIISVDDNKSIKFSDFYCFSGWDSSARHIFDTSRTLYGRDLQQYNQKFSGIVSAIPTDYIYISGTNYHIKRISKNLVDNETEIEAINYST